VPFDGKIAQSLNLGKSLLHVTFPEVRLPRAISGCDAFGRMLLAHRDYHYVLCAPARIA